DPRIRRAADAVEARFADALTVDDLARIAGMSRFHFCRQFRGQMGVSPYQHLVATRVRRAAELLRRGRYSVTETAFEVGFSDPGRFARAFRRHMGCAPSAYAA
ncbi:MAG: helix-turn-helix transcriptional regulator, partial [Myxococcales bacterium]|nr:helix-turn-helix transcriptional regulator [Myxococcales bacterium]